MADKLQTSGRTDGSMATEDARTQPGTQISSPPCQLLGIHKTRTSTFHPRSDGTVERYKLTIERQLAMFIGQHQSTWDQQLPMLLVSYGSAVHETTGFSPSMLVYGRELTLAVDLMYGRPDEGYAGQSQYVSDMQRHLEADSDCWI